MIPTNQQLAQRLTRVEKELAILKAQVHDQDVPWYRRIKGDFARDRDFAEILRLGRLIRRGKIKG
jgi:hypothetical protein